MHLIDSHCHLYLPEFQEDIHEVIARAKEKGIEKFFLPNIDSGTIDSMCKLANEYPGVCYPMIGLHPTSVKENHIDELKKIKEELVKGEYCAIGEIGIDLYWDKTFLSQQKEAFRFQIKLAKEVGLPVVIHSRESFNEIFNIIDEENDENLKGIFHCFTGSKDDAIRILNYGGFKLGIGGVVTFKNGGIDKFLSEIPLECVVLETDSPYLAPVPYRGKRNESSYLIEIAERLATIYNKEVNEIAEITTTNSLEIFGIK